MAHRDQAEQATESTQSAPGTVEVRLADLEPFCGLVAALARFCVALDNDALTAMPPNALEALSQVQGILWRLEHANVDRKG